MDPHHRGAPMEHVARQSPLKRVTNWLGLTREATHQERPHYVVDANGRLHPVVPQDSRIERSGIPISTFNYHEHNQRYYETPVDDRTASMYQPQQQFQHPFPPSTSRSYQQGQPRPMVTPDSPATIVVDTPQGRRLLQHDLQAAEARFHSGRALFPFQEASESIMNVDGDDFVDSISGEEDIHEFSDSVVQEDDLHSTADAPTAMQETKLREKNVYGHIPNITVLQHGKRIEIAPSVAGFDHPIVRNPDFKGQDMTLGTKGKFAYYGVKIGYDPGIFDTYGAAWVRTADYQDNTKCSAYPNGIASKLRGFPTYKAAVAYLGWDPSIETAPDLPFDPKPPRRHPKFCRVELNMGPDPHDWCGVHFMSVDVDNPPANAESDSDDESSSDSDDSSVVSVTPKRKSQKKKADITDVLTTMTTALTNCLENSTIAAVKAKAEGSSTASKRQKAEEAHRRILDKTNNDTFPSLVENPDYEALNTWFVLVANMLSAPHWNIDGVALHLLKDSDDSSEAFKYRSAALARGLFGRLTLDNHTDVLAEFSDLQADGHGVTLLHSVRDYLDPQTDQTAMREFTAFCSILQENGETIKATSRKIQRAHARLKKAGFDLGAPAMLLQLVKAVITGAYSSHSSFQTFAQDIIQGRIIVKELDYKTFVDKVHLVMVSANLVKNNAAIKISTTRVRRMDGGNASSSEDPWFGDTCLDEMTSKLQFSLTNCLCCRYPKHHGSSHFMPECDRLKKMGYTITYDRKKDQRRKQNNSGTNESSNTNDANDGEPRRKKETRKEYKARRSKLKKAKESEPDETEESDTDGNSTEVNRGGAARRVQSDTEVADEDMEFTVVDVHNINKTDTDYFEHFAHFDQVDSNGIHHSCIGRSKFKLTDLTAIRNNHRLRLVHTNHRRIRKAQKYRYADMACLDSGATGDMLNDKRHFGKDFRLAKDLFVYMGDGTPIKVVGTGTARIKIEGKVIVLPGAMYIPELDCNLLSITQHALRGKGCTYLAADGMCHLTFPGFTVSQAITENGDPLFPLEKLQPEDYEVSDFNGFAKNQSLDLFKGRLAFLRRVHRGRAITRTQQKNQLKNLKSMLKSGKFATKLLNEEDLVTTVDDDPPEPELGKPNRLPTDAPSTPNYSTVESAKGASPDRYSRYELETLFGGRQLKDYSVLGGLGDGLKLCNTNAEVLTIGRLVNIKRGRRRHKTGSTVTSPLQVVGMDIGYGVPGGPGGHKYVLVLVDKCTTHTWTYGMHGTSGADIQEALWKFFIEAGGFPQTMQCDFDPRFVGGRAIKLLRSHGCRVRAAPPHRQSQNGLVERRWQMIEGMARSYLKTANLPKRFWYWSVREAARRLNLLPISTNPSDPTSLDHMTTPFEAFYGTKPDYRVLFPFGSVGSFRRPRDGSRDRTTFESQGLLGIALGRSEFTNGMIFYNPTLDSFCTSADYRLDPHASIAENFPSVLYDGGLSTSVLSSRDKSPSKFGIGDAVYVRLEDEGDVVTGVVETPPTAISKFYTVKIEDGTLVHVKDEHVFFEEASPAGTPSMSLGFFTPEWMKQDCQVTLLHEDKYKRGYLNLDAENDWEFVTRNKEGKTIESVHLLDLPYSWKYRLQENSLSLGWQEHVARRCCGIGRHVSAANLVQPMAPTNLVKGLAPHHPDSKVWKGAYEEEYDGLSGLDTFAEINEEEYQKLLKEHGEKCKAIPTMNIFTVKKDKLGKPVRAKSRIVVLGNLERRVWEKADRYAPVLTSTSSRLLISMAVQDGRIMKQGDCKNAFCQPTLPDDEITIVRPPKGCPKSKPGTYWRLKKTLYGLARSPRHWFDNFTGVLRDLGFESMPHDPCVFKCTPIPGEPPIFLGCYVDDFIFYSRSDRVEEWFEEMLTSKLRVDFMGAVSWFLGSSYEWHFLPNGKLTCHISQQAYTESLVEKFDMVDSNPARSPYRSGLPIDRIPRDDVHPDNKKALVKEYQSLMGGLIWLVTNTRPDINVATNLLGRFNANPSQGHMTGAKHILRYLSTTASYGIRFTEDHNPLAGHVSFPPEEDINGLAVCTDSSWGPQDASNPKPGNERTCILEEMHSIGGYYITRMGGPLQWSVIREKRISGSSCEAEIKAMDEGTKGVQFIRHLMMELGLLDANQAIPILNDNSGAIDWTKTGGPASKKTRHMNIREFRVAESQKLGEVTCYWVPGKENPSDLFTKEHKDIKHYQTLRDLMICPLEDIFTVPVVPDT